MANGYDDQPPGGQSGGSSGGQPPADTGPNLSASSGGGSASGIGDGWGEGDASFDDVIDNVQVVFQGVRGEILKAWFALVAIVFLCETFEVFVNAIAEIGGLVGGTLALVMWPVSILLSLVTIAVTGVQFALYGPLKERVIDGVEPAGFTTLLKDSMSKGLAVVGALFVLAIADVCTCLLPGLVLVFFGAMAPYLLATREIGFTDAFKQSYEYAKRYWEVFAVTIGAVIAASVLFSCCAGAGSAVHSVASSPYDWSVAEILSYAVRQYAGWVGITLFQFALFVVWGGVFVTVDAEESGQSVQAP